MFNVIYAILCQWPLLTVKKKEVVEKIYRALYLTFRAVLLLPEDKNIHDQVRYAFIRGHSLGLNDLQYLLGILSVSLP